MHWGVPFRGTTKRELTDSQQAIVDAASAKIIALRETYLRPQLQEVQDVSLTGHEIALLIDIVEDRLAECGNDATELRLQLNTGERQEVEALVRRLRHSIQTCVKS
jgi:hypothetical protein